MKDKMAEVEEQPAAAANGNGAHTVDSDDEESAARPVDIEQDMREMDRRKRVEAIMSSKLFREELERVVSDSIKVSICQSMSCDRATIPTHVRCAVECVSLVSQLRAARLTSNFDFNSKG